MPPDIYFSYLTGALWAIAIALYGLRVATRGSVHSERVAKFGASALVGRGTMDMAYWAIEPLVRGLARAGITANALTWAALVLGLGAGAAAAAGWYGLTCLLGTLSTVGDILDGQVARLTKSGSNRGELLDAAVDRYTEFALLAGLALALRDTWWQLALALGALLASYMVSYATAKAEALGVPPPRGLMRRHERAVYLLVGVGLVPLIGEVCVSHGLLAETPVLVALAVITGIGNVAAVARFVRIGRALR